MGSHACPTGWQRSQLLCPRSLGHNLRRGSLPAGEEPAPARQESQARGFYYPE